LYIRYCCISKNHLRADTSGTIICHVSCSEPLVMCSFSDAQDLRRCAKQAYCACVARIHAGTRACSGSGIFGWSETMALLIKESWTRAQRICGLKDVRSGTRISPVALSVRGCMCGREVKRVNSWAAAEGYSGDSRLAFDRRRQLLNGRVASIGPN